MIRAEIERGLEKLRSTYTIRANGDSPPRRDVDTRAGSRPPAVAAAHRTTDAAPRKGANAAPQWQNWEPPRVVRTLDRSTESKTYGATIFKKLGQEGRAGHEKAQGRYIAKRPERQKSKEPQTGDRDRAVGSSPRRKKSPEKGDRPQGGEES